MIIDKDRYIYLAGNISEDPKTFEWREEFTSKLINSMEPITLSSVTKPSDRLSTLKYNKLHIVNPCSNKFENKIKDSTESGLEFTKIITNASQKILRSRDYKLIKDCDLLVVHLGYNSKEKPMIGTVQELTWAHDVFYIPVIAITGGEDNIYTRHPWIDECCSAKVETIDDAVNFMLDFFI